MLSKELIEETRRHIDEVGAGPAVNGVFPLLPGYDHDGNPLSPNESARLQGLSRRAKRLGLSSISG